MNRSGAEFSRAWRTLLGCILGLSVGVSSLYFYSLGIFIRPMAAEFGWTRGEASLGAFVGTAGAALVAIPVGRMVDRFGSVPVAIGSLIALAVSFALFGWVTHDLLSFLLISGLLSLTAAGSSPLPFTRLIVARFKRQRGLALGIALSGIGAGAILVPKLLLPFVATHGWRAGYLVMALLVSATLLPLTWLLQRQGKVSCYASTHLTLKDLIALPVARLLGIIFFLAALAVLGTVVQFVPMLADWGMTPARAGSIAALIGISAIAGRLIIGVLLDRLPSSLVASGLFAVAAVGLESVAWGGTASAVFASVLIGCAVGAEADLLAFLIGRHTEQRVYGQVYGAVYSVFLVGAALGPILSGYLRDFTSDYRVSLLVMSGLLIAAALLSCRLAHLPRYE